MIKWKSPLLVISTILLFIWFCMIYDFAFAQETDLDLLFKIQKMSYDGDYEAATNMLKDFIVKFKIKEGRREDLAFAYYLLGRIYFMVGMDQLCEENLFMVFELIPDFTTNEIDFMFSDYVKVIKEKAKERLIKKGPKEEKVEKVKEQAVIEVEKKVEKEEAKSETEPIEWAKIPVVEKEATEDQIKNDEKAEEQLKKIESKPEKKVITRISKRKPKKKFPWLLVAGGVVVAGIIIYLLTKKSTANDDDQIDPDYDTTGLGIQWIDIPAGEFLMGDNFNEGDPEERPVHAVYLDSYSISKYEVTFDQYDNYCELTNRNKPYDEGWGRANRPVINISWDDAKAFCDWLSEKTGKNIHLLTEAQWEKAARGTDQRRYPWGNSAPDCGKVNYNHCVGKTTPVGNYPAGISPYGVYDMAGNVWEWCQDWYSSTYYSVSPNNNPAGPASGSNRVIRGGSWYSPYIRASYRHYNCGPSHYGYGLGFRLALD